jgi:hypothetical protein
MTTATKNAQAHSDSRSPEAHARAKARQVLDLERRLAQARQELTEVLGANGRITVDAGTFQAVPAGWRPNGRLTSFLLEHRMLASCLVQRPVVSMAKVNELAQRRTELAAFLTLQRAAAAGRLVLRFRAAADEDEEPTNEG